MKEQKEQLLTQTQVAARKRMTLQNLAHHLAKPDAPAPVIYFGKKLYRLSDITEWKPRRLRTTREN